MNQTIPPIARDAAVVIDPADFRRSLGCFPTGVAVATTMGRNGRPIGLTISSFNSVSLDPPLVLWSLALSAASLEDFRTSETFAINVLSAAQANLCRVFSSPVADRFVDLPWKIGDAGAPVLEGSAAIFECRTFARHDGGDHEVIIGQVLRHLGTDATPLVYAKGRLGALPENFGE